MPQKGIEGRPFRTRFGVWPRDAFKAIDALIEQGLLCQEGEGLFLTTKGILLSNEVFARLSASSPILSSGPIP
jgi:coproporphyrinogen III oxidase-like Fe-S oxidoreductase